MHVSSPGAGAVSVSGAATPSGAAPGLHTASPVLIAALLSMSTRSQLHVICWRHRQWGDNFKCIKLLMVVQLWICNLSFRMFYVTYLSVDNVRNIYCWIWCHYEDVFLIFFFRNIKWLTRTKNFVLFYRTWLNSPSIPHQRASLGAVLGRASAVSPCTTCRKFCTRLAMPSTWPCGTASFTCTPRCHRRLYSPHDTLQVIRVLRRASIEVLILESTDSNDFRIRNEI